MFFSSNCAATGPAPPRRWTGLTAPPPALGPPRVRQPRGRQRGHRCIQQRNKYRWRKDYFNYNKVKSCGLQHWQAKNLIIWCYDQGGFFDPMRILLVDTVQIMTRLGIGWQWNCIRTVSSNRMHILLEILNWLSTRHMFFSKIISPSNVHRHFLHFETWKTADQRSTLLASFFIHY